VLTDPIADMLTRIRNGGMAGKTRVDIPGSRIKREIARVLRDSGFIDSYETGERDGKPVITVDLRYNEEAEPMIGGLERVSRPGRRVYVGAREVPSVRNGLGVAILSTPRGIMTDIQARDAHVGGEVLARVW
jgi:small subunit ribosomal protein S8